MIDKEGDDQAVADYEGDMDPDMLALEQAQTKADVKKAIAHEKKKAAAKAKLQTAHPDAYSDQGGMQDPLTRSKYLPAQSVLVRKIPVGSILSFGETAEGEIIVDTQTVSRMSVEQEFSSAGTSLNQVASLLKNGQLFEDGDRNLDLGGGRFDQGVDAMENHGVESRVMDEFNRDDDHNESVQKWVDKDPVDTVTVANVLNVIKEPEARAGVIQKAYDSLKDGGKAYFQVYYDGKKEAGQTKAGWQNHFPLKDYLPEVQKVFPDAYLKTVGNTRIIIAPKEAESSKQSVTESDIKALGIPVRDTKRGVGKRMGNDYYVHKSQEAAAIEEFGETRYRNAKRKLPKGFEYDLIHINAKAGTIEFISSPDWDTASEPVRGEAVKVSKEGVVKVPPKKRQQIYHHKWSFVGPDYTGFDVQDSMDRSGSIGEALPKLKEKDPKITNRYGFKDVWESEVVPELDTVSRMSVEDEGSVDGEIETLIGKARGSKQRPNQLV